MDKINIKYIDNKHNYEIRVPEDFNTFQIYKYSNGDKKTIINHLIYDEGRIDLKSYVINDQENFKFNKEDIQYDESEKEKIIKSMLVTLVKHIGFNSISVMIVSKLGYDVNYLRKKLKEKNLLIYDNQFNVIERIEEKVVGDTEYRNTILDLLDYNCEYVANISIIEETINVQIHSENCINIMKIVSEYFQEKNNPINKILKNNN